MEKAKVILVMLCGVITASQSICAQELAEAYHDQFLTGTAISNDTLSKALPATDTPVCKEFNAFTAENAMKWQSLQPRDGEFDFTLADKLFELADRCGASVIGHTLIWHQQTPEWVFKDEKGAEISRKHLLERMKEHIYTVAGRYKGRVLGWDVVNEALNDDGSLRDTPWRRIIGDDYLIQAFRFAREADPDAQLYYNDFNLYKPEKVAGAVRLIHQLTDAGIDISAVGMQGHYSLFYPELSAVEESIKTLISAGTKVSLTELDVSVLPVPEESFDGADVNQRYVADPLYDPYRNGLPESEQKRLADVYEGLFSLFVKYAAHIDRVTLWGTSDDESWRNNWPVRGRVDYPLLFDRNGQPKLAYKVIVKKAP